MADAVARFEPCGKDVAEDLSTALDDIWTVDIHATAMDEMPDGRWQVVAYLDGANGDAERLIGAALADRSSEFPAFALEPLVQRDWVAEGLKDLAPVRSGRFLVHGAHDRHLLSPGRIGIEIEAGQAFGTGHHGTTLGCLDVLGDLARRGFRPEQVLDLGTGSGVLAIAAALAFRKPVVATDIDPIAVSVARENGRLNTVGPLVRFGCASGTRSAIVRQSAPYELIFANILAKPLIRLAPDIAAVAALDGILVISGLLDRQAQPVRQAFEAAGFRFVARHRLDGWSTLVLRKRFAQK